MSTTVHATMQVKRKTPECCHLPHLLTVSSVQHSCRLSKIRASVGKALKARNVPRLEFRLNELTAAQAAVEEALDRLKAGDP